MNKGFFKSLFGRKGADSEKEAASTEAGPAPVAPDRDVAPDRPDAAADDASAPAPLPDARMPAADPGSAARIAPSDDLEVEQPAGEAPAAAPVVAAPQPGLVDPSPDALPVDAAAMTEAAASEPPPPAGEPPVAEPSFAKKPSWLSRLRDGLTRTSSKLSDGVTSIFTKRKLDDETLEELEDLLISADLGAAVASKVTQTLARDRFDKEVTDREVREALAGIVTEIMTPAEQSLTINPGRRPHVILMTGVNGAGKTTTIGKLAAGLRRDGRTVMLAAGDTFRAAAIEQLQAWGARTGCEVIASAVGADAAGLAYDAVKRAQAENVDVLLIDTAGRLQNRRELMDELAKIVRVIRKLVPDAPHDTLLVLDATVGQNAISQAGAFKEIAEISGLVMTKLDGTARGGVLVALTEKFALPVHYIGVGEGIDDLQTFRAEPYARALAGLDA